MFDFLRRNTETYAPEYALSAIEPPDTVIRAFGYQLPLDEGAIRNRRVGTPFWISAEREGHRTSVLRVPVTYPADPISSMLSGMGVPDLLGTQGTFTFYTTEEGEKESTGGRIVTVAEVADRDKQTRATVAVPKIELARNQAIGSGAAFRGVPETIADQGAQLPQVCVPPRP